MFRMLCIYSQLVRVIWTSRLAAARYYPFVGEPYVLVLDVIVTESHKSLEFLSWVSGVGIAALDLVGNYTLKRESDSPSGARRVPHSA